jgi:hypothetical protein
VGALCARACVPGKGEIRFLRWVHNQPWKNGVQVEAPCDRAMVCRWKHRATMQYTHNTLTCFPSPAPLTTDAHPPTYEEVLPPRAIADVRREEGAAHAAVHENEVLIPASISADAFA